MPAREKLLTAGRACYRRRQGGTGRRPVSLPTRTGFGPTAARLSGAAPPLPQQPARRPERHRPPRAACRCNQRGHDADDCGPTCSLYAPSCSEREFGRSAPVQWAWARAPADCDPTRRGLQFATPTAPAPAPPAAEDQSTEAENTSAVPQRSLSCPTCMLPATR